MGRDRIAVHPPANRKEGILPLIPIILGAVAAAGAASRGKATAVKRAKESKAADAIAQLDEVKKQN